MTPSLYKKNLIKNFLILVQDSEQNKFHLRGIRLSAIGFRQNIPNDFKQAFGLKAYSVFIQNNL